MEAHLLKQVSSPLLSVDDIAAELNVSVKTIYYWVGRLEIPFLKIGRHLRFDRDEVLQYFKQRTEDGRPCLNSRGAVKQELNKGRISSQSSLKISSRCLAETSKKE